MDGIDHQYPVPAPNAAELPYRNSMKPAMRHDLLFEEITIQL